MNAHMHPKSPTSAQNGWTFWTLIRSSTMTINMTLEIAFSFETEIDKLLHFYCIVLFSKKRFLYYLLGHLGQLNNFSSLCNTR